MDFSVLRTAEDFSDYSLLELQWNGLRFAAVPALIRDGGVLLVLPEEAFSEEKLTLASADGFSGLLGPFVNGSCTKRGTRRTELQSEAQVLIVDLDSDTLGNPEFDGVLRSAFCTGQSQGTYWLRVGQGSLALAFGGGGSTSRGALPQIGFASSLAPQPQYSVHDRRACKRGVPGFVRPAHSFGALGCASDSGHRRADIRLEALEAQVRALVASQTALLSAQQNTGQGISGAGRTGASVPPLFEAEAGRTGLSLEQLTALLGAAGRPLERLHDGRPATLLGASSSSHLPLQNRPVMQAAMSQPASLLRAKAPPLAQLTGATALVGGELDAASLLAALAQQNSNMPGALAKNRGDSFGDYLDTEERPTAGVRGYQARQQFQASLKRDPDAVYSAARRRLAEAIETDEASRIPDGSRDAHFLREQGAVIGFYAGPRLFRVRRRTALGGRVAGRFGRVQGSGSFPSSLLGRGGRGRWAASAGLALHRDAEPTVPAAGPFAEGPRGPGRVPWGPALGRGGLRLPEAQGRGLPRGSRETCGRQDAVGGPAYSSGTPAKGKSKGSSEGSSQDRCRRRRRGSTEAGDPGACAVVSDSRSGFRVRLSREVAAHVPGPRGSAAVAAEPPPFSADADAPLFRFLLTPTQKSDQRVNEFDAITLALSLRRRIL